MGRKRNLAGMKFGKLRVVSPLSERDKNGAVQWLCECECGNSTICTTSSLTGGHRTSCGCNYPMLYNRNKRLYNVWRGMISRCENPNTNRYHRYGGRGIRVCDEWHDFSNFLEWSMANGYNPDAPRGKCTIDRIDNNKGYSPSNCQWVDSSTQASKTSRAYRIEIDDEVLCLAEAARKLGISINTVRKRIEAGWPIDIALSTPPSRSANNKHALAKRFNRQHDS